MFIRPNVRPCRLVRGEREVLFYVGANRLDARPGVSFFCRDRSFYSTFFRMMLLLALQNIITYSVNIADNIMLGSYSQASLSGAAAVNQIQYILQQFTVAGVAEGLVVIASQHWGQNDTKSIQRLTGAAMTVAIIAGLALTAAAFIAPEALVGVFTDSEAVREQAVEYISLMRYSYVFFIFTNILLARLRSMQSVGIAFRASCAALVVNVCINYVLIFGHFGAPEMGIQGAAVGTLVARGVELLMVLHFTLKKGPAPFHWGELFKYNRATMKAYLKTSVPCVISAILFSCAVAVQTAIFGHLSEDAMAASSISGTLFQYFKMVPISAASAACVIMAKTVGSGERDKLRPYVHTFQLIFFCIGLVMGLLLFSVRGLFLSFYSITEGARTYAMQMLLVQSIVTVGMAYQMPCQLGIIRGGGDTRYSMISDLIYSWIVVVPLGLLTAFVFNAPVWAVTLALNCDQLLKCVTVSIKTNSYTWVKTLTEKTK